MTTCKFNRVLYTAITCLLLVMQCAAQTAETARTTTKMIMHALDLVTYLTGDSADVATSTTAGLLLAGGGKDVDGAVKWFLQKSNAGDVVVLRASGADGYNEYMFNMVPVNSVETILIDSREKALLPIVAQKIRNAEAIFIAGGDQWNYIRYWKDTPVEEAINYALNTKKVPVGGTSAGLAVMGSYSFSAMNGSAVSTAALNDPYSELVTINADDFIAAPFMKNTITDSHYTQRDRQGRHIVFMARLISDLHLKSIMGIGIDEQTAVCTDENGIARVYGKNDAYFLWSNNAAEVCQALTPLTWNNDRSAVNVYKIAGAENGNGTFNLNEWMSYGGGTAYKYYVINGRVLQSH